MPRERFKTLTEQMFYILLCLHEECRGMDILEMVRTLTNGRVNIGSGTLYDLLEQFLKEGAIEERNVIGTYDLYGRTREIYNDPLPLEIEDLADVDAQWSKEADHQETFLLSSTEYRQYAVPTDGNDSVDERKLEYTVTDVKQDFLYDFIKRAVLNSRQDEVHDDFVFTDHYEPIDASVWNADDAYQLHWSDSVLDTYLIFWETASWKSNSIGNPRRSKLQLLSINLGRPL